MGIGEIGEAGAPQGVSDKIVHFGLRDIAMLERQLHVARDAAPRQQREILKNKGDWVQRIGRETADPHIAGARLD